MMKLSTIFEQLTYGEFSQLALGGLESGGIAEDKYRQVASNVVLALTALYTRFNLKTGQLTLALQPDQVQYALQSKYAVNGLRSTEPVRYILDTVNQPFGDDILKVEKVVVADTDFEMELNKTMELYACSTPAMDTIQVPKDMVTVGAELPDWLKTSTLTVMYRANHPAIMPRVGYFDPERVNIELPNTHLQALLLFVAWRVHTPAGMSNEFVAGNNYYARYEAECQLLNNNGIQIDKGTETTRFRRNGWV